MNLDFIAGLIDADGSLALSFEDSSACKYGLRRKVILNITNKDKKLLDQVQEYLQCGRVVNNGEGLFSFRTNTHKDAKKLIPLFEKRLHGSAKIEMPLWKDAVDLVYNDKKSTGFIKFTYLMYCINSKGANRKYEIGHYLSRFNDPGDAALIKQYENYGINVKTQTTPSIPMNRDFISGYCQGDGSFYLSNKERYITAFSLTDAYRGVLEEIQEFLLPGSKCVFSFYPKTSLENKICYRLQIDRFDKCKQFIIPHFDSFPVVGRQRERYLLWREAVFLAPRTDQNKARIAEICALLKALDESIDKDVS